MVKARKPCSRKIYKQIRVFYETFNKLTEQPQKVSDFEYEKQKLICNVKKLWPRIEELCKKFNISLERVKMEEVRVQAARRYARRMSGEKDLPEPEFQLPRKELVTLALVKSFISSLTESGKRPTNLYDLMPENLMNKYSSPIISQSDKINKILTAVLARLSEYFGEEIETKSSHEKPAGTKQENKPPEKEQKEIVEVKPGVFGITVDIKELSRRFWKWVCSRSKDRGRR